MRETYGSNTLDFFYDSTGTPYALKHNGTVYYYVTNLQGDVMNLVDGSGNVVATYDYDPYGKVITATGTMAAVNPLRYRGYYYDTESGLYYLQSRYYDPAIGRFINADSYASTGQGIIGNNMFAYCANNPVMGYDPSGHWDWSWEQQAATGTAVILIGLALLFAPPTGGASLAGLAISAATISAAGGAAVVTGMVIVENSLNEATVNYAKQSKKSGKERATDKPSWVSQSDVDLGKSSQQNATEMLNNKYGSGNWSKGPRTEFNQIVKWIDRGLKVVILVMADILMEK